MARIEKVYGVLVLDHGLYNKESEQKLDLKMFVFDENEAKRQVTSLVERVIAFDPLEYSRTVIEGGRGVRYTRVGDPKCEHYCKIWYEEREIVLL